MNCPLAFAGRRACGPPAPSGPARRCVAAGAGLLRERIAPAHLVWLNRGSALILLAFGAFFAGYLNWPAEKLGEFLHESPSLTLSHQMAKERTPAGKVRRWIEGALAQVARNSEGPLAGEFSYLLFALGVMLYQMLVGRPPFVAAQMADNEARLRRALEDGRDA